MPKPLSLGHQPRARRLARASGVRRLVTVCRINAAGRQPHVEVVAVVPDGAAYLEIGRWRGTISKLAAAAGRPEEGHRHADVIGGGNLIE